MTTLNLLAISAFFFAAIGLLRSAFTSLLQGSRNSLPGFQQYVQKPKRARTSEDPFYRG